LRLLLDNVRSVFNVGSIFRTADGCGIDTIDLCGITPTPEHSAMKKTALGAEKTITWQHHNNSLDHAEVLLRSGKTLWGLEYTENSIDLHEAQRGRPDRDLVLVLGNEVTGVDPGLLALCERTIHIPMRGQKASLNVATAAGIAGYALCRPRGSS
jgi:tRNA G18 (ribose-2'-O)-methylase SpoU